MRQQESSISSFINRLTLTVTVRSICSQHFYFVIVREDKTLHKFEEELNRNQIRKLKRTKVKKNESQKEQISKSLEIKKTKDKQ